MSRPGRRRPVFDPSALDNLDDTLAPPEPPPSSDEPDSGSAPASDHSGDVVAGPSPSPEPVAGAPVPARPGPAPPASSERGAGTGRPRSAAAGSRTSSSSTRQPPSVRGRVATAVRLPADLYQQVHNVLLSGPERPSYGQLVMWAVEDHPGEVAAQVEAARPDPSQRVPRGRKLAQDRVPVALQLLAAERDTLDEVADSLTERLEAHPKVTRTDVATAALRVALRARPSPSPR